LLPVEPIHTINRFRRTPHNLHTHKIAGAREATEVLGASVRRMFPAILIPSRSEAHMISQICDLEAPERQGLERLAAGPSTAGPGQWRVRLSVWRPGATTPSLAHEAPWFPGES
jgi:hypothetical protein